MDTDDGVDESTSPLKGEGGSEQDYGWTVEKDLRDSYVRTRIILFASGALAILFLGSVSGLDPSRCPHE